MDTESTLKQRYKVFRKGSVLLENNLAEAIAYCLAGTDSDLDIRIGDYVVTLADGTGWPGNEE